MGMIDKAIRILVALVIGILFFTDKITGTFGVVLLVIASIFLLTSFVGFCPLYLPFGIKTNKKKNKQ